MLKFQQQIKDTIVAHFGPDHHDQVAIAPLKGGFGVHNVEVVVMEEGDEEGLQGQFIEMLIIAVAVDGQKMFFDKST